MLNGKDLELMNRKLTELAATKKEIESLESAEQEIADKLSGARAKADAYRKDIVGALEKAAGGDLADNVVFLTDEQADGLLKKATAQKMSVQQLIGALAVTNVAGGK